jgi:hypothetical protein
MNTGRRERVDKGRGQEEKKKTNAERYVVITAVDMRNTIF